MQDDDRGKDAPPIDPAAGVSYVMPVLNERRYLQRAVATVLAQRYDGPTEVVLALGPSTDGTNELARQLAAAEPRIRLVENPAADIPVGLNLAIRASSMPVIIRVDAHSELDPDYTGRALTALHATGAANVGGIMHAEGRTPFQRAVARAYNSPIGLGGGAYHGGTQAGEAESAYLGVMNRAVVEEVGLFDESIRRGEDWELNLRIRQAGYRVWFDPTLSVTYWPRESWNRLVRQFVATGTWRGELIRRYGRSNAVRFFAPPALVIVTALSLVLGTLQLTGAVAGWWSLALSTIYVPLAAYVLLLIAVAVGRGGGRGIHDKIWTLAVIPTMHFAWGIGLLIGLTHGAEETVDTSRLADRNTPLP